MKQLLLLIKLHILVVVLKKYNDYYINNNGALTLELHFFLNQNLFIILSPFEYMKYRFREDIDGIKECFYKLWVYDCYLQCWDKCHDDKGYANGMPDFCSSYDEAFMCGSWVDTTKWTRKDFMDKIRSGSDA